MHGASSSCRALCISTVDMHTGGEPLRIVTDGLPELEGRTVLEKRRYFRERFDHLRTGLMFEPRGHADMYGAILTRSADADFDVFFLHNEGYSTMCGHAIIALTRFVIEAGLVDKSDVSFNVPAGRIEARAHRAGGHILHTSFRNVPSFVYRRDEETAHRWLRQRALRHRVRRCFLRARRCAALGLELVPHTTRDSSMRAAYQARRHGGDAHRASVRARLELSLRHDLRRPAARPRSSQPQRLHLRRRRGRSLADRLGCQRPRRTSPCKRRARRERDDHDREHPWQHHDSRVAATTHRLRRGHPGGWYLVRQRDRCDVRQACFPAARARWSWTARSTCRATTTIR